MLDMIRPKTQNKITLQDLKRCKMTPVFFDTFFNLEKYLDHEQRDPFATQREVDEDGNEVQIIHNLKDFPIKVLARCRSESDLNFASFIEATFLV